MIFCRSAWHDYRFTWITGDLLYAAVHKLANFATQDNQRANNNNMEVADHTGYGNLATNKYVRQRTDRSMDAA